MTSPSENSPRRRSVELQVEVPGTPEQVWEAIATGRGITAWFVPAKVDEREGGGLSLDIMGKGMEASGVVTAWDPPRRFVYEEENPFGPEAPARLASEWLVEARSGGTCVVRLGTSLFARGDEWDDELEDLREGWGAYLHNLRVYMTHFAGQPCSTILLTGDAPAPMARAWAEVTSALGLPEAADGQRANASAPDGPRFAGTVERSADTKHHRELMLRLDEPAPGVLFVFAFEWQDHVYATLHAYLFGEEGAVAAAREAPRWRAWMERRFPSAEAATEKGARAG